MNKAYTILYVDDEVINTRSFYSLFRRGFNVLTAESGEEGLKLIEETPVDLIISDQQMPGINGVEFLVEAKKKLPNIPMILLTAFTDYEVIKDAINKVGIYSYINKPFDFEETKISIENALQSFQLRKDLRESERKFKEVFDSIQDVFIRLNFEGKVELVSPSVERVFGYTIEELDDKLTNDFYVNSEDRERLISLLSEKGSVDNFIVELYKKDGSKIWVSSNSKYFRDAEGVPIGIESILRDVTDQVIAEQNILKLNNSLEDKVNARTAELEMARKELSQTLMKEQELGELKSRFVATASHQFRTPLTVIQSSVAIMAMNVDKMEDSFKPIFEKASKRILDQIGRMTDLMNEILLLEKIQSGGIQADLSSTNLSELVRDIVQNYEAIDEEGRTLLFEVEGTPRNIMAEAKLIEQAISNSISNAVKYSQGKPAPLVKLTFTEDEIIILVKDYGIGIPSDELENIFEPFHRAANVANISGTGLGMAILKEYVELNKGTVEIKSEEHQGTECIITFKQ